jgi:CHAT domain-containing protein
VVLSACQTNAGRNATGEGIYSLARGFSSAGIPAVASTLWQADEQATYDITQQFHRQLSQGMPKDEALRSAKLQFIRENGGEHLLPYYWANMILIGDAGPIKLRRAHSYWWVVLALISVIILLTISQWPSNR